MRVLLPVNTPVQLLPEADGGYGLRGATRFGALFDEVTPIVDAATGAKVVSPRGFARYISGLVLPAEAWLRAA